MSRPKPATIRVLGVPMDLGAGRRGVDMGPSAIRIAGVDDALRRLGYEVVDDGDVAVPAPEARAFGDARARYLREIFHVCDRLRLRVRRALEDGSIPLVMGGDHSIAIGTTSGVAEFYRARGERIGLIWVDAHADMNTPATSPSGNIHGMPLAVILGMGPERLVNMAGFAPKIRAESVCLIGIRNLDEKEKVLVQNSGLNAYTMRDVDERGIKDIMTEALARTSAGTAGLHVSFDMDSMDPAEVPGVGTPVRGGLDWREANLLMEMVADSGRLRSLEISELNPILDLRNESAGVVVDLISSAFGKRIL